MTQTTHWDDCWNSGPEHYECAVWEVKSLQAEKDAIKVAAWDKSAEALKQLNEAIDRAKKAEAEYARIAGDYSEEASYLRKRAEQAEAEVERLEKDNAEWQDGYSALTAEVERLREYAQERALLHSQSLGAAEAEVERLRSAANFAANAADGFRAEADALRELLDEWVRSDLMAEGYGSGIGDRNLQERTRAAIDPARGGEE